MNDTHPNHFEIPVDRPALRRYLRAQWFRLWVISIVFLTGILGFVHTLDKMKPAMVRGENLPLAFLREFLPLILGAFLVAVILYFVFSHARAARYANSLEIHVEGPYLRLRHASSGWNDRKIHFRSLVDYTVVQDRWMAKFGIASLVMTTQAGGQNPNITIVGIKDALRQRDILIEVDAARERAD